MTEPHPDFELLAGSWQLALGADRYAANTVLSYTRALVHFAAWLGRQQPGADPTEVTRDHVRAWIIELRESTSSGTARSMFPGVRHFYRWMVAEGETEKDPTEGIRTPRPNDTSTPTVTPAQIRAMLATCTGQSFLSRRDEAIIMVFVDGGLRLAEVQGLPLAAVDPRDRMLFVEGKGSNRSGPRRRAVPLGVKAARAVDRYVRERRRHPYADRPQLWLGARGRPSLSMDGIDAMLKRRAALAGVTGVHSHVFRHSWASAFRKAGGSEGDLMVLGGWHSRQMLDRYGRTEADERAREAYRRLSFGDRL
jgi:integrase/recombinase XerC